jgi:hypothetical protein
MLPITDKNSEFQRTKTEFTEGSIQPETDEYSWQKQDTMEKLLDAHRWEEPELPTVDGRFSFTLEIFLDIGIGFVFLLTLPFYMIYLLKLVLFSRFR